MLALNLLLIGGLVIVGLSAHSLGVLAAGGDSLADSLAIALGLFAIRLRDRAGGRSKATTVVAGLNGSLLLLVTLGVMVEAVRRLVSHSPQVQGLPVLIASVVTMLTMLVCAVIAGGDDDDQDLHMRSIVLDTVADAVAAGAVATSGAIILWRGGWYWLDAAVALGVGLVIAGQAGRLLRDVKRDLTRDQAAGNTFI
ncbi:hypothetical protein GCM10027596_40640 [Nocardioides korecus]